MFLSPTNVASLYLIALLFIHSHIKSYCQIGYNTALPYSVSGMTPLPVNHMAYAHAQPIYHLPQDKTEIIVVGDRGGKQHHHHHHHHHHKNIHHHHHGHKHSHGHNHNHDHKHDHDHKHGHNHNHKHGHNHDHKHDHGHNHQHLHGHGHLHHHGHNHDHKHAHILLHRLLHRQKHSPNYGQVYQEDHNNNHNYGSDNTQHDIKSNGYEQHPSDEQVNAHQLEEHHFKPQNQHNSLTNDNYETNYPDHVSTSFISTDGDKSISHNGGTNQVQVHYDEPEQGDVHSHYEHSASNENASYQSKDEDSPQADHSQSSENFSHKPNAQHKESVDKSVYSSEQGDTSSRFSHSNFQNKPLLSQQFRISPPTKSYSSRYQNTNIRKNHGDARGLKVHDKHSDELSAEPQVHYGVRLQHGDYHKKEASISSVTFLQGNGELITVGNNDPLVSVGKPLKLEDSNPQLSYHGESLESKLSIGRMTLTPARDYKASIAKIDEVLNVPLFD